MRRYMKVLWLVNMILPPLGEAAELSPSHTGGWMVAAAEGLMALGGVSLTVMNAAAVAETVKVSAGGIDYICVPAERAAAEMKKAVEVIAPDVIHLHGTEFPYAEMLIDACPQEKYIASLQGVISFIALHYTGYLDEKTVNARSFRDVLRRSGVRREALKFVARGETEKRIIKKCGRVIGRTNWDRACVSEIYPQAEYYFCNESLRDAFYDNNWSLAECEKHTIFFSQAIYPLKGLHLMLKAMPEILREYPDARLYVAGSCITRRGNFNERLRLSAYGKYLLKLIDENGLGDHVIFTGSLAEKEMCERLVKSHVFVCASSIENSPNSLGEAMLTGVPCVAACVGGVQDLFEDRADGFMYPADEYYMISWYVKKIFADDALAQRFSAQAAAHARITHDRKKNSRRLWDIYEEILGKRA